jgi:nickel transport protein
MFHTRSGMAALVLALTLLVPAAALAHKVSIFAYVEGKNLVVDAFYSKSNKVNHGQVTVHNAATGEEYARVTTDENGAVTIPIPAKAIAAKADLRLRLVAGEGHQDDTTVSASEFAGLSAIATAQKREPAATAKQPAGKEGNKAANGADVAKSASVPAASPAAAPALDEAALARIVNQAVEQAMDSKLAPVKRLLLQSAERGPGPTEIAGGIGYIVGLFGVAAFIASRRKGGK